MPRCAAETANTAILLSVGGSLQRGSAMRSGFLALFLCAHLTALCQSVKPAPAGPGKTQQAAQPSTACSPLSAQFSTPCAAPQINALPSGSAAVRLWNTPQFDASHLFASPLPSTGARLPHSLLAQNVPLVVSPLQPAQWPGAKCEPIPTQWPEAKLEKIPTQWPHLSVQPVSTESGSQPGTSSFTLQPSTK